jgi:HK97 family phage portal protein
VSFVVSDGAVRSLDRPALPAPTTMRLTDDFTQDYAEIWRTQPAVRMVVSFLARNIASLGLHAFRRISDTDRERLTEHPLAQLIAKPNPRTTRYRLFNSLVHDLGIFDTAYWLKAKASTQQYALLRLPPHMTRAIGNTWLWPEGFEFKGGRGRREFGAEDVVHFHGHNPTDARTGAPPIESLRRVLAEEYEAGRMREQTLRNGARVSGYLQRPKDAPRWSDPARERFRQEWHGQYVGSGPQTGGTPILEDGMTFSPASQTAEQLQYVQARKLTREEVAAAYFIPPPMVGILDQATFSNITEQHKMLYQDTLGPWLTMITEELGLQLLPDLAEPDVYVEFNLAEKLRGSFEEQAQAASTATGRPWMTANEQRARFNLPAVDGGDDLVVPLNVLVGGQANPRDSAPEPGAASLTRPPSSKGFSAALAKGRAPGTHEDKHTQVLGDFFARQAKAVKSRLGAKADEDWWDEPRWNRELGADLWRLSMATSVAVATQVLESIGAPPEEYDSDRTAAFLAAVADRIAQAVNAVTKTQLDDALATDDPAAAVDHVFEMAASSRAAQIATTTVTAVSGFASTEAAKQYGGDAVTKTWRTGTNPRPSHARMDGETVGIEEPFSNGAMWPADAGLDVDEVAGCNCAVEITVG